jgi:ABC-type polysaccharide/polyol phosphate export permease
MRALAVVDLLAKALRSWPLWTYVPWIELRLRYRRSVIGPLWQTASVALLSAALAAVYGTILKLSISTSLPYIICGFITWTLISSILLDSGTVFTSAREQILGGNVPVFVFPLRMVVSHGIVFLHHLLVLVVVYAIWPEYVTWRLPIALFGIVLIAIAGVLFAALVGLIAARYRDVVPLLASTVSVVFFVTPVLWPVEMLGERMYLATLNPLYYFLDVVRAPLLGRSAVENAYAVCLGAIAVLSVSVAAMAQRVRTKLAFYL